MKKPKKIGIFSFACCEGCQLQILDLGPKLLKLLAVADITYFKLAQEKNIFDKFDIAIVEGAISNKKEEEELKQIRSASKCLVAIGACAVSGGIPSLIIENSDKKTLGVDNFVNVDYHLRGCPIDKDEFEKIIIGLLIDKREPEINHPVCVECNEKEVQCLFKKGLPCLGPVTAAGCKAICPENSTPCEACRGLIKDANLDSVIEEFKRMGLKEKEILDKIYKFNPLDNIKGAEQCT